MRKCFIIFLSLAFIMVGNAFAERQLLGTASVFALMQSGTNGATAYFVGGTYPAVQKKTSKVIISGTDTLIVEDESSEATYEFLIRAGYLYADQETARGFSQTQGQIVSFLNRKTLGFWNSFIDLGGTYTSINNSEGDDEQVLGYYLGTGIELFNGIKFELGVHAFNTPEDEPTKYAPGITIDIGL